MEPITASITALGGLMIAAASYWLTKQREREAEWRREKLERYKAFVSSLSGVIEGESTADGQRSYARACNELHLFAPQAVLRKLYAFQDEIRVSNTSRSLEEHNNRLSELLWEIRRDLGVNGRCDDVYFKVRLFASGVLVPPKR